MKNKINLIAEIGVNHNGKIEIAKKMISLAKKSQCDFVKFQLFKAENLVKKNTNLANYQKKNSLNSKDWIKLIKELKGWFKYDLPENLLGKLWRGKYRGQKQKWFVMKFIGKAEEINIKTKNPEFLDWKWIEPSTLPDIAVDFNTNIYKRLKEELKILNSN